MERCTVQQIVALSMEPAQQEETLAYMAAQMERFVKPGDSVLLCFPEHREGELSWLYEQAVIRCGGTAVIWGPDHRWKTLLQQAFYTHARTVIGPPLIVLGLTKLVKHSGLPLYIRHVVTAGYPCLDWMIDGIRRGFDCSSWGSFGIGTSGVVAGFSCGKSRGVHLRQNHYAVDILDPEGNSLPVGMTGELVLYPRKHPQLRLPMEELAYVETAPCDCGCEAPRLMGMRPYLVEDSYLMQLGQEIQSWTSVLDCRLCRSHYGLEMELVVFPGEKLPQLPSAAKQIVRPWDPNTDEPFPYHTELNF